jgi:hypothetical protein
MEKKNPFIKPLTLCFLLSLCAPFLLNPQDMQCTKKSRVLPHFELAWANRRRNEHKRPLHNNVPCIWLCLSIFLLFHLNVLPTTDLWHNEIVFQALMKDSNILKYEHDNVCNVGMSDGVTIEQMLNAHKETWNIDMRFILYCSRGPCVVRRG